MSDKFRRKKEPRHIRLYHSITGCEAWHHLSGNAMKVLIALARFDDGNSNGQLFFSERTGAAETGLSRNTVRRSLAELVDKGFIAQTKPGAFNRNNLLAATWRLTWVAWPGGDPAAPTRDFEKWKPGNSQAQNLTSSGSKIAPPLETSRESGSNFDPPFAETPHVSVTSSVSGIEPQVLYQGDPRLFPELEQRKQANSSTRAELDGYRQDLVDYLSEKEPGTQRRVADYLGIPGGTFSKFLNGSNLPERYHAIVRDVLSGNHADAHDSPA